jgi:hypothetical protein
MTNLLTQDVVPSLPSYRFIPLTKGLFSVVDAADYDFLNQWKWYARGKNNNYYACRRDNETRRTIDMHTAVISARKGMIIDHRSGFGLDNRRINLRYVTSRQNSLNRRGQTGIHFCKRRQKWKVAIYIRKGVRKHLGYYEEKTDAVAVRLAAEKRYYRGFPVREDIPCPTPPPDFISRHDRLNSTGHRFVFRCSSSGFFVRVTGFYVGWFRDVLKAVAARDAYISRHGRPHPLVADGDC